ncbi:MAG: D-lyxose/D-mannose family sugar isomerase [Cyclobacteriaceae bacterium]|nr:D-lyxose/D-mannose family sugar isomerase [Cyclobacteriaceae bacterium]
MGGITRWKFSETPFRSEGKWRISKEFNSGDKVILDSGERITLVPGIYHEFYPVSDQCIIGEVSTANDDLNDNFFVNDQVGRFPKSRKMNLHW